MMIGDDMTDAKDALVALRIAHATATWRNADPSTTGSRAEARWFYSG